MAGVGSANVLIFTQQFASMLRSRLQLVEVLDNLANETPQRRLRETIEDIVEDVRHGTDLAASLAGYPHMFDDVYVNVVKAGLESGRLGEALAEIARYLKVIQETRRKVRSALTYPVFVILAFFGVFNAMVFGILPRFQMLFRNFGKELPPPTQFMLDLGAYWQANWFWIIGAQVVLCVSFLAWVHSAEGRRIWDEHKLKLPILGRLWRMAALARFLRTFAVQVDNEVAVLQSLKLAADTCGNTYIQDVIYEIAADVEIGRGLAASFRDHRIFHGIVLQMIAAGEEAGVLNELLISSAEYFDSLVQEMLDHITQLINPILTVVVGLAVAGMMVACFLPVFQLGGAMGVH